MAELHGTAPTYVTIGDGGNRESLYNHWAFHRTQPWSAFRNGTRYGFGQLTVFNDSLARWTWLPNHLDESDSVWIRNVPPGGCGVASPPTLNCAAQATWTLHPQHRRNKTEIASTIFFASAAVAIAVLAALGAVYYHSSLQHLHRAYSKALRTIEMEDLNADTWDIDDSPPTYSSVPSYPETSALSDITLL